MTDAQAAVVLFITAGTFATIAHSLQHYARWALYWFAVNVAAIGVMFLTFAVSVDLGVTVRPYAKIVDAAAAILAALHVAKLASD